MPDLALLACIATGTLPGVISGLTPGLHLNNFAAMLLALSPQLLAWGLLPFQVAGSGGGATICARQRQLGPRRPATIT